MSQSSEVVAYDLCKSQSYAVIGTFLECSLCKAGWPMKSGRISISFYTDPCRLKTGGETFYGDYKYPSPSWFWGFEATEIQLSCVPTVEGVEYQANVWQGRAERSGRGDDAGANITMEILARFEQVDETTVSINLDFNVLKNGYWIPWFSASTSLARTPDNCVGPACGRAYASDYIAVSPNNQVCKADLRYIKIAAGTEPWFEGCGPAAEDSPVPLCSFFNGYRMFTCFRTMAYSKTNPPEFFPNFSQIGYDLSDCGYLESSLKAECSCLYGIKEGPHAVEPDHYIRQYFDVGCPGESGSAFQKVQVGMVGGYRYNIPGNPSSGGGKKYKIVVKDTGSGSICVAIQDPDTLVWQVASSVTTVREDSPTIIKAEFTVMTVYLYALKFPNPNILPSLCYDSNGSSEYCSSETFSCNGTCTYTYSALLDSWVLTSGSCYSSLGYTCSCTEPPSPATISPYPTNGDTYQTNCR
jgi:hypothetical protein